MKTNKSRLTLLAALALPIGAVASPSTPGPVRLEADGQGNVSWVLEGARGDERELTDMEAKAKLREIADKFRKVVCDLPLPPSTATLNTGMFTVTWQADDLCHQKF